jgi:hypothetical protein
MTCFENNALVPCDGGMGRLWILLYVIGAVAALITFWCLVGYPRWRVWAAHQEGLADLANARNEQQVQVAQAQGRLDAANLNKQAAIVEAEAVAAQIKEIGEHLRQHDLYLKWQWIKMMEERPENSTIYVPTEAGLPILEAGKRGGSALPDSSDDN